MLCDPVCIRQSTDETSNTKKAQKYLFEAESDSNKVWGEGGGIYGVQIGNSDCAHLIEEKESRGLFCPLEPKHLMSVIGKVKSYSFGAL